VKIFFNFLWRGGRPPRPPLATPMNSAVVWTLESQNLDQSNKLDEIVVDCRPIGCSKMRSADVERKKVRPNAQLLRQMEL